MPTHSLAWHLLLPVADPSAAAGISAVSALPGRAGHIQRTKRLISISNKMTHFVSTIEGVYIATHILICDGQSLITTCVLVCHHLCVLCMVEDEFDWSVICKIGQREATKSMIIKAITWFFCSCFCWASDSSLSFSTRSCLASSSILWWLDTDSTWWT